MSAKLAFNELEDAAKAVIQILQSMPEFANTKIAVIGGLGIWKYLRHYRITQLVQGAPRAVKDKLLAMPDTRFEENAQVFVYKSPGGKDIQVDITPEWQSPYLPEAAVPISSIAPGTLPYISEVDLLVFNINSCGLRPSLRKKVRDETDARTMVRTLVQRGPITFNAAQKAAVMQGLGDIVQVSDLEESWRKTNLGLE